LEALKSVIQNPETLSKQVESLKPKSCKQETENLKNVTQMPISRLARKHNLVGEVIDPKLGFGSVGGLDEQMKEIRENVLFPLMHKQAFAEWGVEPVKGIIFHGPPGTGKTLLAKALAAELSRLTDTPFTFFYRKGTDSIQEYIGSTEKYLEELFENAKARQPAIIFFDEIDGLCSRRDDGESNFYVNFLTTCISNCIKVPWKNPHLSALPEVRFLLLTLRLLHTNFEL